MSGPFFDVAVERPTRVNLRVVPAGDSGQLDQFASSILLAGSEMSTYCASPAR